MMMQLLSLQISLFKGGRRISKQTVGSRNLEILTGEEEKGEER